MRKVREAPKTQAQTGANGDAGGNQRQLQTTKLKYIDEAGRLCTLGLCQDVTELVRIRRENATTKEAYEKARSTGIIYTHIAQALSHGYESLYYINLDTGAFLEYSADTDGGTLTELRRGQNFFESCIQDINLRVHPDDRQALTEALNVQALLQALGRGGIVIACGMAKYEQDASVAQVFERADHRMYENKVVLKGGRDVR